VFAPARSGTLVALIVHRRWLSDGA
jgi:hypothetical protein